MHNLSLIKRKIYSRNIRVNTQLMTTMSILPMTLILE